MLKKQFGVTARLTLRLTLLDGQVRVLELQYINRGACRDVFGTAGLAAKLQQANYHETSNAAEARAIEEYRRRLGDFVGSVIWCGMASFVTTWRTRETLSCLLVAAQGEDLLRRVRRLGQTPREPGLPPCRVVLAGLRSTFRAFLDLFLWAYDQDIFFGDYGLRQVCVRPHAEGQTQLTRADLVLVDVEGICAKSKATVKPQTFFKKVWLELQVVFAQAGEPITEATLSALNHLATKQNLDWYPSRTQQELLVAFDKLLPAVPVPPAVISSAASTAASSSPSGSTPVAYGQSAYSQAAQLHAEGSTWAAAAVPPAVPHWCPPADVGMGLSQHGMSGTTQARIEVCGVGMAVQGGHGTGLRS